MDISIICDLFWFLRAKTRGELVTLEIQALWRSLGNPLACRVVAQLVERRVRGAGVAGSNPVNPTMAV